MRLDQEYLVDDLPEGNGGDFEPIPAGWYNVNITEAGLQDTKAGTGKYIKLRLDVTGPEYQGRVLFTNLNISNPNPKAEEIGQQQLCAILRAIGLKGVKDTDELIGGNMSVKVTIKDDPTYGKGNEVKAFKAIDGASAPAPSAAPKAAASGKPPWAK